MRVGNRAQALKWICITLGSLVLWGCPEPEAAPTGDCVDGQVTKCACDDGREGIKGCNNDLEFGECHCLDDDEIEELIGL